MIGIGVDLVEVPRMRLALERTPRIAERLFSDAERAYAYRRDDPAQRFAARFAVKEAVMKAMGVGLWKFNFRDVEVVKAPSGQPSVRLTGRAAELAAEKGVTSWLVTMTHTDSMAEAIAIAL